MDESNSAVILISDLDILYDLDFAFSYFAFSCFLENVEDFSIKIFNKDTICLYPYFDLDLPYDLDSPVLFTHIALFLRYCLRF